jgi:uncharacterized protein (DUF1697 family)
VTSPTRQVVLLRGVNLGARNRVAMPRLRALLEGAGFEDVRTYLQSGNVVLSSPLSAKELAARSRKLIADDFGLDLDVLVRTLTELAKIVERNPLAGVATDPKRYQVSFLETKPPAGLVRELARLAAPGEKLVAIGRELYAWHPAGVARSKLWAGLADRRLGIAATARNWTTVTRLLALADEGGAT